MTYDRQVLAARAIAVALAVIGAIQVADPAALGLGPHVLAWLAILTVGLGITSGFLPNVMARSRDPEFLADRISDLPRADRQTLATEMAARAHADDERRAEGRA